MNRRSPVADASLREDRGLKKRLHAEAEIPLYWVVNLVDRRIETYAEPSGSNYRSTRATGRTTRSSSSWTASWSVLTYRRCIHRIAVVNAPEDLECTISKSATFLPTSPPPWTRRSSAAKGR
ncbi:MAG TPA: Uma2 family endonuclease [Thermoanaerobaculia bacterium]